MKHVLIFFLLSSIGLFGCSSNDLNTDNSSKPKVTKTNEMDERHVIYLKGLKERDKGNYTESVKYFTKAALQGHYLAKNDLAVRYFNGEGVTQDYKQAFYWFKQVVDQSPDVTSNFNIAQMYRQGLGVKKNLNEAIKNYEIASKMGNIEAKNQLGLYYQYGEGVNKNLKIARDYFIEAANGGSFRALNNLGVLAANNGDYKQARKWYKKAIDKGSKQASKNISKLDTRGL